ncbi:hypothetical protein FHS10_001414 [Mucilaginibacter dorajii]|nr:hypothetical protein [Mucilaginibacter dorajii]
MKMNIPGIDNSMPNMKVTNPIIPKEKLFILFTRLAEKIT